MCEIREDDILTFWLFLLLFSVVVSVLVLIPISILLRREFVSRSLIAQSLSWSAYKRKSQFCLRFGDKNCGSLQFTVRITDSTQISQTVKSDDIYINTYIYFLLVLFVIYNTHNF